MMNLDPGKLKDLRRRNGLSQAELSEQSKVSQRQLARLEGSKTPATVRPKTMRKLADALRIDLDRLLANPTPAVADELGSEETTASASGRTRTPKTRPTRHKNPLGFTINPRTLRNWREWKGLSRRQVSALSGISERQIARIESSRANVSVHGKTSRGLARALDVCAEQLATDKDPVPNSSWLKTYMNEGWLKEAQLSARVNPHVRLAYDLVARRYGISIKEMLVLAPLLFVLLAEASLAWRRQMLQEIKAAMDHLASFGRNEDQFYFTQYMAGVDEGYFAEKESVTEGDVSGKIVRESAQSGFGPEEAAYAKPFESYLRKLVKDLEIDHLVEFHVNPFDSPILQDEAGSDSYWGLEQAYSIDTATLDEITGGSKCALMALRFGHTRLNAMPDELAADSAKDSRVTWLEDKVPDNLKYTYERTKGMSASEFLNLIKQRRESTPAATSESTPQDTTENKQ